MEKIKANKVILIEEILSQLKKGKGYSEIYVHVCTKWDLARSTFSNYWKIASKKHTEEQKIWALAKQELDLQGAVDEYKAEIADVVERKEILTKILRGEISLKKAIVVAGTLEYYEATPDWMDRKNAIAELNKMDGDYAPIKINQNVLVSKPMIILRKSDNNG